MPLPCRSSRPRAATAAGLLTLALIGGAPLEAAPPVSMSPTITIDTGSGMLSGTLAPFAGFTWHLFSLAGRPRFIRV